MYKEYQNKICKLLRDYNNELELTYYKLKDNPKCSLLKNKYDDLIAGIEILELYFYKINDKEYINKIQQATKTKEYFYK